MAAREKTHISEYPDADMDILEEEDADKFLSSCPETGFNKERSQGGAFSSKLIHYKEVFAMGFGWLFLFMALMTLRNLQSSINHQDGVGLIFMGTFYGGMMIGSFLSSAIVQTLGPKITLVIASAFHVGFVAANFYPNLTLLATVGAVAGISHSALWAAQSTYLTALAKSFANKFNVSYGTTLARFFGIGLLFAEVSMVLGNPLASFLLSLENTLYPRNENMLEEASVVRTVFNYTENSDKYTYVEKHLYNSTSKDIVCGRHYCHSYRSDDKNLNITDWTRYVVVGTYTISATLAMLIFLFVVNDRHVYVRKPGCADLPDKLLGTIRSVLDIKMMLFIPLMIFFGFQMAFVSGDVVKAYISCPTGVARVGNLMLFFGILDAVSCLSGAWLKNFLGSVALFTIIAALNCALFVALLVWEPDGGIWSYMLFSGFGCIQGLTNVHVNSQVGIIFKNSVESAYSVYRLCLGLGLSAGFTYSPYFCMGFKIWLTMSLACASVVSYYMLEIVHRRIVRSDSAGENGSREL